MIEIYEAHNILLVINMKQKWYSPSTWSSQETPGTCLQTHWEGLDITKCSTSDTDDLRFLFYGWGRAATPKSALEASLKTFRFGRAQGESRLLYLGEFFLLVVQSIVTVSQSLA